MLRLLAWLTPFLGLAAVLGSAPEAVAAKTPGLQFFYCYAVDPDRETVFVSDMHDVGPVAERAAYGEQFARYLKAKGKASGAAKPFCVMRATEREITRGRAELQAQCSECGELNRFEDVAWLRDRNKGAEVLLAGKLIKPNRLEQPGTSDMGAETTDPAEGEGVTILGRSDQTDVVYSINQDNGTSLAHQKADLKGGKWTTLLSDSRCPGWLAVAYASNGDERWYFVAQRGESEGEVSSAALDAAEQHAAKGGVNWTTGVIVALRNNYEHKSVDLAEGSRNDGVVQIVKEGTRRPFRTNCPTGEQRRYVTFGVRG